MSRPGRAWLASLPLAVALAVVGLALALPSPSPDPVPADGPPRLSEAWPSARTTTFAGVLADGSSYRPMIVVDEATSVGLATSADAQTVRLVVLGRDGDAKPRELRVHSGPRRATVAAATIVGDELFWIEVAAGTAASGTRTSVWRAGLSAGQPRRLCVDSGDILYYDSAFDLQVADGRVYWAAGGDAEGEVRSVPVEGGPVLVRRLDRRYALAAWPWVTSTGDGQPGDAELLNLATGERRRVGAAENEILACGVSWCRVTTLVDEGASLVFDIQRLDGDGRRRIGDTALIPINTDVALLDRFEVLTSSASSNASGFTQRLWLYDLGVDRMVLLSDAATQTVGSRDRFLWWSTGDNETLVWNLLDLRQLS